MTRLKSTLLSLLFVSASAQHSAVLGQDYYLWKGGNPGLNGTSWTFGANWESEIGGFVISNSAPGYGNNFTSTSLLIAGSSQSNQRAIFNPGAGTTTFGNDLRIGANQTVTGVGVFNQAGFLEIASGNLAIGGSGFLSSGNGAGASTLDVVGGRLTIGGASLDLNGVPGTSSTLNLTGGVLVVNQFTKANSGSATVNLGNGTLQTGLAANSSFFSNLSNTTVNLTGNTTINAVGASSATIAIQMQGAGGLTKTGTGTLILSSVANSFSGKSAVQGGVLSISQEVNLGSTPGGFVADQLQLGSAGTAGTLQATSTFSLGANRGVTLGGNGGVIEVGGGSALSVHGKIAGGGLVKSGTGTLVMAANNSYTGNTAVDAGTLRLGGASGNIAGNVAVANGATFEIANSGSRTFAGTVTNVTPGGTGRLLANIGAGNTLILSGSGSTANIEAASGATQVNGSFANQTTTVNAGAGLGGTGTVGNLVVNGTLAPGASIESLGAGNVTYNNGAVFSYELNSAVLNGDLLAATGSLTINAGAVLNFVPEALGAVAIGSKLTLVSYNGTWNGGVFNGFADDSVFSTASNLWQINYNDLTGGGNFAVDQLAANGVNQFVTITAVPEPSSLLLLGVGACFLFVCRRRLGA